MDFLSFLEELLPAASEVKGILGEFQTAVHLGCAQLFGLPGKVLHNVYVPRGGGDTTEIDLLFITAKGIFVIESKNYSGYIFGDERQAHWTQTQYCGKDELGRKKVEKFSFYNPIWQNHNHIKFLRQYLTGPEVPMHSVVVFSDQCRLKDVTWDAPEVTVCQQSELPELSLSRWRTLPDCLSETEVDRLFNLLQPLTSQDRSVRRAHVDRIHQRMEGGTCPRCGAALVLRTARSGPNAGKQFWGCGNFPKCRYTRPLQ